MVPEFKKNYDGWIIWFNFSSKIKQSLVSIPRIRHCPVLWLRWENEKCASSDTILAESGNHYAIRQLKFWVQQALDLEGLEECLMASTMAVLWNIKWYHEAHGTWSSSLLPGLGPSPGTEKSPGNEDNKCQVRQYFRTLMMLWIFQFIYRSCFIEVFPDLEAIK